MRVRMDPDADMELTALKRLDSSRPNFRAKVNQPKQPRTVILIMVTFKYDYKAAPREVLAISRGLHGWPVHGVLHAERQVGYVVETHLNAQQMLDYLKGPLVAGCIERAHAFTPGADAAATMVLDPLAEKIAKAWASVRRYNAGLHLRRLPPTIFERSLPLADDPKGTVITRILDNHPLDRKRA